MRNLDKDEVEPGLQRRLGTSDAVVIGLGAMIGAGLFSAFTPAASAAGSALLVSLVLAAAIAYVNARSSAQLAARYPTSGGTYAYGREVLGPWAGFIAGWGFVIGKIASAAVMALTFATYTVPEGWVKPVAALAVAVLVGVNCLGVTRTAAAARIIVATVLVLLGVVVAVILGGDQDPPLHIAGPGNGVFGVLQGAGLLFFAFAGYARIATLGEEVRNPARSIPRAIGIGLGIIVVLYAAVAVVLLNVLGAGGIAQSAKPLAVALGNSWALPLVQAAAALASLGALLALIAGIGRTSMAMAREHDLPHYFSRIHPRFSTPYRAELAVGAIVIVLVAFLDLRTAIGFSSFGVLVYYLIANIAASKQPAGERLGPAWLGVAGAMGCVLLVATLPFGAVAGGLAMFAVGIGYRAARLWFTSR
ncbi:APC family permease [Paeniglutamicibacter gangotriensis]|uniref:APC family permease n=1 Tax=Paeniglutamicibacter gangotriensis TaxID=254787 RepID=A0A5B0EHR5_9MICC|nr:APC family permease [Paeniglutamicibacter gangotriensis]KAA0977371.1 APC family permease [Paeniglutamicibacter gangotriensis]